MLKYTLLNPFSYNLNQALFFCITVFFESNGNYNLAGFKLGNSKEAPEQHDLLELYQEPKDIIPNEKCKKSNLEYHLHQKRLFDAHVKEKNKQILLEKHMMNQKDKRFTMSDEFLSKQLDQHIEHLQKTNDVVQNLLDLQELENNPGSSLRRHSYSIESFERTPGEGISDGETSSSSTMNYNDNVPEGLKKHTLPKSKPKHHKRSYTTGFILPMHDSKFSDSKNEYFNEPISDRATRIINETYAIIDDTHNYLNYSISSKKKDNVKNPPNDNSQILLCDSTSVESLSTIEEQDSQNTEDVSDQFSYLPTVVISSPIKSNSPATPDKNVSKSIIESCASNNQKLDSENSPRNNLARDESDSDDTLSNISVPQIGGAENSSFKPYNKPLNE